MIATIRAIGRLSAAYDENVKPHVERIAGMLVPIAAVLVFIGATFSPRALFMAYIFAAVNLEMWKNLLF